MSDQPNDIPQFDKSKFGIEPYVKKVKKPWGYEIHWVHEHMPYMGKILHIDAGKRLSLQVHDVKQESYWLLNGECILHIENQNGELVPVKMKKGVSYTTIVGQKHRHEAVTDCVVVEVSTPESGITWRLKDDFARPNETPEQRKKERGEV